jgi:murein peptide amidase A
VRRRALTLLVGVVGLFAGSLPAPAPVTAQPTSYAVPGRPAVVEAKVIGRSVAGRAIVAYRVGDPESPNKVVAMSTMHGNESSTRRILTSIRDGRPVRGIDLWLIPVVNPDGLVRHTRKNARGVDLNRNYPYHWRDLDGNYESGAAAGSEPETQAMMAFFGEVKPRRIVSFHQPLHGVDVSTARSRPFARRLADYLNLPRKRLTCGGACYGTFTAWYMARHGGQAVTVEYATHPSRHRMNVTAPRQLLRVLGARR